MRAVGLILAAVVAAGCGNPAGVPVRAAKGGDGTFRMSSAGRPAVLNPNVAPLDEFSLYIAHNIFSRLVALAEDGTVLPDLAERWDVSPDRRTYTFHLQQAVWHDGRPVSAEDVRYTLERIGQSSNEDLAAYVEGVEVVDPATVAVRLRTPWAAFLTTLGWYGAAILPRHIYQDAAWAGHPANRAPVGSGPFRFHSWVDDRIILEKHDAYFGQGPYVDRVEYIFADSAHEAVRLLQEGQIHLLLGRPPVEMLDDLEQTVGVRVLSSPSDSRTYLAFNLRHAPFDRLDARQAVNAALDRALIVERVLDGRAVPAAGFYTPHVAWAYNHAARVPARDLASARRTLAGLRVSRPLTLVVPGLGPTALGRELARQLEEVGLNVHVEPIPVAEYRQRLQDPGSFDLAVMSGRHGPDPHALWTRFSSAGPLQFMGYQNAELDALLAAGGAESDPLARVRAYREAQAILARDLPIAPLYEGIHISAFRAGLRGLPHADAEGLAAPYVFSLIRLPERAP